MTNLGNRCCNPLMAAPVGTHFTPVLTPTPPSLLFLRHSPPSLFFIAFRPAFLLSSFSSTPFLGLFPFFPLFLSFSHFPFPFPMCSFLFSLPLPLSPSPSISYLLFPLPSPISPSLPFLTSRFSFQTPFPFPSFSSFSPFVLLPFFLLPFYSFSPPISLSPQQTLNSPILPPCFFMLPFAHG